jgi:hypothetical protein
MNAREKKIWTGIAVGTCGLHDETNDNGTRPINYGLSTYAYRGNIIPT